MNDDHLAKEADRLLHDDVLQHALTDMRNEALEELASADVEDRTSILRLQQKVAVIEEIRTTLNRYILKQASVTESASSYA